ncbi:hypothetical protein GTA08_BOTSDO07806 [Botryosphaeria dothidea]|uniref:Uncharacterized protein n=1 Tax=Botryosphaeria dothidea TaxID=55169 RepID=A0A8H4N380_9PEZI|nr:hypothetical protein GTA08_BOTSDO07806 [Botryosphaeria dothidea]
MQLVKLIFSMGLTATLATGAIITDHLCTRPSWQPGGKQQCIAYCAHDVFKLEEQYCTQSDCIEQRTHEGLVGVCSCECTPPN